MNAILVIFGSYISRLLISELFPFPSHKSAWIVWLLDSCMIFCLLNLWGFVLVLIYTTVLILCIFLYVLNHTLYTISEVVHAKGSNDKPGALVSDQDEEQHDGRSDFEQHSADDNDDNNPVQENIEGDVTKLTGRQKKLFDLRLKMVI